MSDVDHESQKELRELREQVNGIQASIQTEFAVTRRDIQHMSRAHTPTLFVAATALIVALCGSFVAFENRNMLLSTSIQTTKNTRDLENIIPMVFSTPTPAPKE